MNRDSVQISACNTRTNDFRQLVDLVDALPARAGLDAVPEQSSLPARAPFRLVAAPRRPMPSPGRFTPAASTIGSLTYRSLDTPAPLAPQVHGLTGQRQRPVRNARSGRVALLVPARSILADDGTRVTRFELLRPLKRSHITEDQLAESSWEGISVDAFRKAWASEVDEARTSHKRERLYLATGLLLPVWDKLPSDFVKVSRISAADGRSLLGREVPVHCVPELCRALGLEREQTLSADDIVQTVLASGRAMEFAGREQLMVKRSLVNGSQRIELTGWSAARLDWYKAQGCFTEIIRYQTRLFVPIEGAASAIARLASSA